MREALVGHMRRTNMHAGKGDNGSEIRRRHNCNGRDRGPPHITHGKSFLTFFPSTLETIFTSLWASLHHHFPVLSFSFKSAVISYLFIYFRLLSIHLRLGRPFPLFPSTTRSIIFLERLSSSLLLVCPYQCNRFCLRNVGIWHTLASSCKKR